jgi:licheninase
MRAKRILAAVIGVQVVAGCLAAPAQTEPPSPTGGACARTAADAMGWGAADRAADFGDASSLSDWWVYDGAGHAGNGRRTPNAVSVADGMLTITGDAAGNSGGMAWRGGGQMYGRWEVCAKSSPAAETYHSVALLWPDANDWPVGGEIDFMEIVDGNRQSVEYNLHDGPDDRREGHQIQLDATQWHSWAVEWAPERITVFVDGQPWAESTDTSRFPPRPMHLCLQLDNFGGDTSAGGQLNVDWARQYSL